MIKMLQIIGACALLAMAYVIQIWVGGVIMETKIEAGQHLVRLRDGVDHWVSVSAFVFWAHRLYEGIIVLAVAAGISWALWRWLWHGDFPNSR